MKQQIDLLIINNAPAFYKVNLYNELSEKCKIHVVFLALTNQVVINDSLHDDIKFSYDLINPNLIANRNKFQSFVRLYKIYIRFDCKKVIFGGYDNFEFLLLPYLIPLRKNCIQFESSILESKVDGLVGFLKKIIMKRYSVALTSGNLQSQVFKRLRFSGQVIETFGVGIFNKVKIENYNIVNHRPNFKYIFVGRLIPKKNLVYLINVFNKLKINLTIIGTGCLESELRSMANKNISFTGFIANDYIYQHYLNHDIFILPSLSEPWGLVVEEAIYFGLPVIVSDAVGCQEEMVIKPDTGLSFSPYDQASLIDAIYKIESNYDFYKNNCQSFDFEKRDLRQIEAYLKILN